MTKIGNYGSFFALYPTPKNPKDQNLEKIKKIAEDIIILHNCMAWERLIFFVILGHFFPLYPSNNGENQNFKAMEKNPTDVITSHMYTKNHNHMM